MLFIHRFRVIGSMAVIFIFSLLIPLAAGADFGTCFAEIQRGERGSIGGTDNRGNPVSNITTAKGITYDQCLRACGGGPEAFDWSTFSQQFTSWLLPWLALVSQLPFGTHDMLDNFTSVVLTLGSPTLAAYSLALTAYNLRWLTQRFAPYRQHRNAGNAVTILNALQQTTLIVTDNGAVLTSLVTLGQNDPWWTGLAGELNFSQTWSLSAVSNMVWVGIAYLFTIIEAFTVKLTFTSVNASGQGVGSLWLWLLPIVLLWLRISPKCDSRKLRDAVDNANQIANVQVPAGIQLVRITNPPLEYAISVSTDGYRALRRDEHRTAPIYNYSRLLPWTQAVEDVLDVFGNNPIPNAQIPPLQLQPAQRGWAGDIWPRFFVASGFALFLQWGTTGGAIISTWFSPTIGLGCRSGSFLIYGGVSTAIWMALVISHFLSHFATTNQQPHGVYTTIATKVSIGLRRVGKVFALFNAIWIVVACIFQFSKFFDRCWCNSSVLWWGPKAFTTIQFDSFEIARVTRAWIGSAVISAGSALIYTMFLYMLLMHA